MPEHDAVDRAPKQATSFVKITDNTHLSVSDYKITPPLSLTHTHTLTLTHSHTLTMTTTVNVKRIHTMPSYMICIEAFIGSSQVPLGSARVGEHYATQNSGMNLDTRFSF